jgi:hypothetical protein
MIATALDLPMIGVARYVTVKNEKDFRIRRSVSCICAAYCHWTWNGDCGLFGQTMKKIALLIFNICILLIVASFFGYVLAQLFTRGG